MGDFTCNEIFLEGNVNGLNPNMLINQSPFLNENKNYKCKYITLFHVLKSCMNVFVFVCHLWFIMQDCAAKNCVLQTLSYGLNQYVVKIMNSKNM